MSFHFWRNTGRTRKTRFITLSNSYHGETLGALAVGNVELYKSIYQPLLMDVITVPSPDCLRARAGSRARRNTPSACSRTWKPRCSAITNEVAAVIVEPLVQCAGGMRMYDPRLSQTAARGLRSVRRASDRRRDRGRIRTHRHDVRLRAGRHPPDYLCLSKGLTGGYLPLSVVLTTDAVYDAFYDEYVKLNAFLHSHSYTGNPLACAAAPTPRWASFATEPVLERNRALAAHMAASVAHLRDHPHVAEVRQRGMILAIELVQERATRTPYAWQERRGLRVYRHALERGVLLRPIGTTSVLHAALRDRRRTRSTCWRGWPPKASGSRAPDAHPRAGSAGIRQRHHAAGAAG